MKRNLYVVILLFFCYTLTAQREYTKWFFGNNAAMDFSQGSPTNLSVNAMADTDNPATMSDSLGNILFYSNGISIWNRNHTIMPNGNGLLGNLSGGHTATAVKMPGSDSIYYLFTMDAFAGSRGLKYNVIDMTLNGGLGNIITGQKNITLLPVASEQIVPVLHANGRDIWIVTHPWNSSSYHTYLIDCNGLNTTPVVSTIGRPRNGSTNNATGQITVNPANNRIATANWGDDYWELYDFDNATGVLSNVKLFTQNQMPWGIEFSPDGNLLYLSGWTTHYVSQYNLTNYTTTAISASEINLGNVNGPGAPYFTGYMQRAPDGKIYIAVYLDTHLAVINNPNVVGTGCNLVDDGYNLGGPTSSAGLPDKIVALPKKYLNLGSDTAVCAPFSRTLTTNDPNTVWSTGATGAQITVTSPGTYWSRVTDICNNVYTDTINITIANNIPAFNLGNDTAYCGSFSRVLSTGNPNTVWSTGTTGAQITVNFGSTFWGTVSTACSTRSDTITITEYNQPVVNLGNDTSVCTGQTTVLNAGNPGATYLWQDNSGAQTYNVTTAGNYAVTVTNINGCSASDNVNVTTVAGPPSISIGNDTAYCGTFSRVLTSGNPNTVWSTGVTGAQITVNFGGTYWGTISNSCGTNGDTVVITEYNQPIVNLGNDTSVCGGQTTVLNAGNPGATYHWQDNSGAQTYTVTAAGNYAVTVTNINGCSASDAVSVVNVSGPPAINIGNDTAYCGTFSRVLTSGNPNTLWSTGVIGAQITLNFGGTYWGSVSNACGANSDTVIITEYNQPVVTLGNDTAICPGQTLILNAQNPGATYQWQDNSGAQTFTVTSAGNYAVTVTNTNGCSASDAIAITSQPGPPVVTLGNDTAFCGFFSHTLSTGDNNTLWNTGVTAPQITTTSAGVYWAQLSNVCGTTTDSIVLTQNPVPVINLGNDTVLCTGNNVVLNAGNPGAGYLWSDSSAAATYTVTNAGNYGVTVTNNAGCTASDNINVAYLSQLPVLNIGPDTTYCGPFSRTLISDSINSVWSTGSNSQQITITTPGIYWAETSNACGTMRDSIIVQQNPIPTVWLGNDTPICNGQTIVLQTVSTGGSLVWSDGSAGATLDVNTAGVYWVQVTANGCSSRDTLLISAGTLPVVNLGPDTIVCGNQYTLSLNIPGATYLWENNSIDSFYNVTQSGTYTVTVTNTCGSSTGEVVIELHADECAVLIPTAFSPNEDGANDLFRGICRCPAENYELEIYNRWGELVFKADDIRDGWNGKYQNLQQPLGVYVYQLSYYSYCSQKKVYRKGNVTLVR